jgi:hypothetical protein
VGSLLASSRSPIQSATEIAGSLAQAVREADDAAEPGSLGVMSIWRRSAPVVQKKVPSSRGELPEPQAASIHSSIAATKTRFRSLPGGMSRASSTLPCMLRTVYQRASFVGSRGSNRERRMSRP